MFLAPCTVILSSNINQQTAPLLNEYCNFYNVFYTFRTRRFFFTKTVVRTVRYNLFICQRYKQPCRWKSAFGTIERTLPSTRLPEDKPWGSKHIEDTIKIKILV